jgi:hypothetical protein
MLVISEKLMGLFDNILRILRRMGCFKDAKIVEYGSSSTVDIRCINEDMQQHEENSFRQENLTVANIDPFRKQGVVNHVGSKKVDYLPISTPENSII